jgi:hypothetical protein
MATINYQIGYSDVSGDIADIDGRLDDLEAEVSTVQVAATVAALPDPTELIDGTLAAVLDASDNGQAAIYLVRDGVWTLPAEAPAACIAFVIAAGAGVGELPEDVIVNTGTDGVLGVGWALDAALTVARPADVAVTPLDPDALELGANGTGQWCVIVRVNYDSPAPAAPVLTQFALQLDSGSGFADVPGGELVRLAQDTGAAAAGVTQLGLAVNLALTAGDQLRVVVRHDDAGSITYTINAFSMAIEQLVAAPT